MRIYKLVMLGFFLLLSGLCGPVMAMNKGELVDAIAKDAGLSKADAGKALNAFTEATGVALKKGNRIALVGFGSFSVSRNMSSPTACEDTAEVTFVAASGFRSSEGIPETPFRLAILDPDSDDDGISDDDLARIDGPNNGAFIQAGDGVRLVSRVEVRGWDPASKEEIVGKAPSGEGEATVEGAVISSAGEEKIVPEAEGDDIVGLLLRGIEKSDIRRGMGLESLARPYPPATGICGKGEYDDRIILDEELLAFMEALSGMSPKILVPAYIAMLDTITRVVNTGEEVDLEEFGVFFESDEIVVTSPATTGRNPQTGKEIKIAAKGLSPRDIRNLTNAATRAARTGRNPQTGKEIKIAAKKVAKFKAGKALADTVK